MSDLVEKFILCPYKRAVLLKYSPFSRWIPDERYVRLSYRLHTGKVLRLSNPVTFNEKLQWMKLYDRNPDYTKFVDKYRVREYVEQRIGKQYLIPLLGHWDTPEAIDFSSLPNQFVLKATHDSGSVYICTDKAKFNFGKVRSRLKRSLKKKFFYIGREWAYKGIRPGIVCEELLQDACLNDVYDYKIFCFQGVPKLIQVDFNRHTHHQRNLYTTNWQYIRGTIKYPTNPDFIVPKPDKLAEMLGCAAKLSAGYRHMRTDFYYVNDRVFFGEITLYHGSGYERFEPEMLGVEMGSWLKIDS